MTSGCEVAVDVEHVVAGRRVEEHIHLVELLAVRRQHLAQLGDVAGVQMRAAVRHRAARQQPEIAVRLAVRLPLAHARHAGGRKGVSAGFICQNSVCTALCSRVPTCMYGSHGK